MQARTPLVSIITPVYNAERYIARCISSAQAQSYPNWEQLIIDDGSNDGTADVVAAINDPRVKYLALPHRGLTALAETYNHGLAQARGELVAILEGDDYWPDDKLALQTPVFEQHDVVISWGRALTVDGDDRVLSWWRQPREGTVPGCMPLASLFKILTRKNVLTPAATVMVRRSALDQVGGFRQTGDPLYIDLPTWLEIAATVAGVAHYLPKCLAYYRVHQQQTSVLRDSQMRFQHHDVVAAVLEKLPRDTLVRLQWSRADAQAAQASASLTRGVASLKAGHRRQAFQHFRRTFQRTRFGRERVGALLGMLSAATGMDLMGAAERLENRLRGESLHAVQ
jgi:glycosyltransferase involved in cell wall biosynthesis